MRTDTGGRVRGKKHRDRDRGAIRRAKPARARTRARVGQPVPPDRPADTPGHHRWRIHRRRIRLHAAPVRRRGNPSRDGERLSAASMPDVATLNRSMVGQGIEIRRASPSLDSERATARR